MGIFAVHSGLIYNDIFSKSVNIFGTGWIFPGNNTKCNYLRYSERTVIITVQAVFVMTSRRYSRYNDLVIVNVLIIVALWTIKL